MLGELVLGCVSTLPVSLLVLQAHAYTITINSLTSIVSLTAEKN